MAKIAAVHFPAELKNNIINGGLDFWQEKEGTTTTLNTAASSTTRVADMTIVQSVGSTNKNYSVVRSTDVPSQAQAGFQATYSYLFTMLTGIASPAAGDYVIPFQYTMEGFDYEKLHAKTVTFGFWVKASVAGTYSFCMGNTAHTRSYATTFTVNGSATWEFKTITVTLDSTGTWLFDNNTGLFINIGAVAGTTFSTGVLNTWQSGEFYAASGVTNWQATTNATFQIDMLSLVEGPLGLGATGFARRGNSYEAELAMCQRYYAKTMPLGVAAGAVNSNPPLSQRALVGTSSGAVTFQWSYPQLMRAVPAVTPLSPATGAANRIRDASGNVDIVATTQAIGPQGSTIINNASVTLNNTHNCDITADARL